MLSQTQRKTGLGAKCLADEPGVERRRAQRGQAAHRMLDHAQQRRLQADDFAGQHKIENLSAAIGLAPEAIGPAIHDVEQPDPNLALADQIAIGHQRDST